MNNTRKQIIGLIEPYMDKTLSLGCLVYCKFYNTIGECMYKSKGLIINNYENKPLCIENDIEIEILGHYDITAVLKFIKSKGCKLLSYEYYGFCFENKNNNSNLGEYFSIKDKPLHLYDADEDENLFTILQELGKQ